MGLITLGLSAAAGGFGHLKARKFVSRKLRYTKVVEKPRVALGLATGCATAVALVPVVWALPLVGAGTALIIGAGAGAGVGTGVAAGAKKAKER